MMMKLVLLGTMPFLLLIKIIILKLVLERTTSGSDDRTAPSLTGLIFIPGSSTTSSPSLII